MWKMSSLFNFLKDNLSLKAKLVAMHLNKMCDNNSTKSGKRESKV